MDMPADLTMNTADVKPEEAETTEVTETVPEEAAPAAKAAEVATEEAAPTSEEEKSAEVGNGGLLATLKEALALKDELKAVKEQLAEMTKRAEEAEAYRMEGRKAEALREAGLPEQCARFLGDNEGGWDGAIADLKALRGVQAPAAIPEDGQPVDLEPRHEDGTPLSEARRMLGI